MGELVTIKIDELIIEGNLIIPEAAIGIVVFAHGSGSSRFSVRNNFVARRLENAGLATLLLDLLTVTEDQDYSKRFDIKLLAYRLIKVIEWVKINPKTSSLPVGLFGASTGAAAALLAAAELQSAVSAVVSRGGRPDLAGPTLARVTSPTLLIVGGSDYGVIELNQHAYQQLICPKEFVIIQDATHLFEEAGTLEQVADQAADWLHKYLRIRYGEIHQASNTIGPATGSSCY